MRACFGLSYGIEECRRCHCSEVEGSRVNLQGVLQAIYPHQCPGCRVLMQNHLHLCPECWREAHFIAGCACPKCGGQMLGDHNDANILCDECLNNPRPLDQWARDFFI